MTTRGRRRIDQPKLCDSGRLHGVRHGQQAEVLRQDVDSALLALELPFDDHERFSPDEGALLLVQPRWHDDIHHPELIFQQQEDEPFGGAGLLTADDHAGQMHADAIRHLLQMT